MGWLIGWLIGHRAHTVRVRHWWAVSAKPSMAQAADFFLNVLWFQRVDPLHLRCVYVHLFLKRHVHDI